MKKRFLCITLILLMLLSLLPASVFAASVASSGTCGDNISWTLTSDGVLTLSGSGAMTDYDYGDSPFYESTQIKRLVVNEGITEIGCAAFSRCSALASISLPGSLTEIGLFAFSNCTALSYVTLPSSVKRIDGSFEKCTGLTGISLPEGLEYIGANTFYGCSSLQSIRIPAGVSHIGGGVFTLCASLTGITVDSSNTYYSSDEAGALFDKPKSMLMCYPAARAGFYTIPDSVTTIDDLAFYRCSLLTRVMIPAAVTYIGDSAFFKCESLKSVFFYGNAPEIEETAFCTYGTQALYIPIPGITLYYDPARTGWSSPTWNGYPTATWDPALPQYLYDDIPQNAWYVSAVNYVISNGLMNGVSDGIFRPEGTMTRAMLVTVLWRYEAPQYGYTNNFTDVDDNIWYADAVGWAAANGIVTGVATGRFNPNGNITREQMAAILYRYAAFKGLDTSGRASLSSFPDGNNVSGWAQEGMQWCVAEGIIGGSNGKLLPQGNATRAQVSAILMRFIENVVK